jgi:uncharacterized membrane protein YgdD (TMEM256/DUF423 family)
MVYVEESGATGSLELAEVRDISAASHPTAVSGEEQRRYRPRRRLMTGWSWVKVAAILGFLGVGFGAFGAHGLKDRLDALGTTATFQTAVHYHMYHALALLALGAMAGPWRMGKAGEVAGSAFLIGVILFSGSLYLLAVTGVRRLGMITPFGGVAMLVGWLALAVGASTYSLFDTKERPAEGVKAGAALPAASAAEFDAAWQGDVEQARRP